MRNGDMRIATNGHKFRVEQFSAFRSLLFGKKSKRAWKPVSFRIMPCDPTSCAYYQTEFNSFDEARSEMTKLSYKMYLKKTKKVWKHVKSEVDNKGVQRYIYFDNDGFRSIIQPEHD